MLSMNLQLMNMCTDEWHLIVTAPQTFPQKAQELVAVYCYAQNKDQKGLPEKIPGYWWLF